MERIYVDRVRTRAKWLIYTMILRPNVFFVVIFLSHKNVLVKKYSNLIGMIVMRIPNICAQSVLEHEVNTDNPTTGIIRKNVIGVVQKLKLTNHSHATRVLMYANNVVIRRNPLWKKEDVFYCLVWVRLLEPVTSDHGMCLPKKRHRNAPSARNVSRTS